MLDMHEIQAESDANGWENGPLPRSKHGNQMLLVLID